MAGSKCSVTIVCEHCSAPFDRPTARGRLPRYCSRLCKDAARPPRAYVPVPRKARRKGRTHECEACGVVFAASRDRRYCSRQCEHRVRGIPSRPCGHCGAVFKPHRGDCTTFCGRDCSFAHKHAAKLVRAVAVAARRREGRHVVCRECGNAYDTGARRSIFCSDDCRKRRARRQFHAAFVSVRETNPTITKRCRECGTCFTTNFMASARRFCSQTCSRRCTHRAAKAARRARKLDAFVTRVDRRAIILRDGGMCQLCGQPVDLTARVPQYWAATMDHAIPLAKGGTHEPANVQLAHFICNSRKGASI